MTRLTADIISRTEFDSNYQKGKQIFHLLTLLQHLCARASRHLCFPGSRYANDLSSILLEKKKKISVLNLTSLRPNCRFFPSKYNREIKSLKTEVERLLMEIIQSRKDCVEIGRSSSYGNDLLGMLLNEMQKKKSGDGFSLNLQLIMDECKTFFFAGHETTALLLTWTVMLLATNPSWQDKVRAQVKEVCGGAAPSPDQLSKLTLVIKLLLLENAFLFFFFFFFP